MEKTIVRKTLLRQILERFAFLVLPLLGIYLLMEFTYHPHSRCIGNDHHHTMGPLGYVIMAAAVVIIWLLAIALEQLLRFFKKDKKVSFLIVFLLVLAVVFVVCFV